MYVSERSSGNEPEDEATPEGAKTAAGNSLPDPSLPPARNGAIAQGRFKRTEIVN
jgi:hypothetical protein